jgi:hypothetical protein
MGDTQATIQQPTMHTALASAQSARIPAGFSGSSTKDVKQSWFHAIVYGETDRQKTRTSAKFRGPQHTFILLAVAPEQLASINGENYRYARLQSAIHVRWALTNPEAAADAAGFPEWKSDPERCLVIDDLSECVQMLVEDNETDDNGRERDGRKVYGDVNSEVRIIVNALKRRQMHLILIAGAKVATSGVANEETVRPDFPDGAYRILSKEMEHCFYLQENGKILTQRADLQFKKKDEKGKEVLGLRKIFAKNKPSEQASAKPVLAKEEPLDLGAVWEKIRAVTK